MSKLRALFRREGHCLQALTAPVFSFRFLTNLILLCSLNIGISLAEIYSSQSKQKISKTMSNI